MISQREKSAYLAVCIGQVVFSAVVFGVFYAANSWLRVSWLAAPESYAQILTVMLLALAAEMLTRPEGLRSSAGRAPRRMAMSVSRRQSLWLAAGFGVFLTLTHNTAISRAFLVLFVLLSFPLFYFTNRSARRWIYKLFPSNRAKMRSRALVLGPADWCASIQDRLDDFREYFETQAPLVCPAEESPESIMSKVAERTPDLLILDWIVPGTSGIELCRRIRLKMAKEQLPIMMLTASAERADREFAVRLGANDYVTKPFQIGELLSHVRALLPPMPIAA